MVGEMKSPSSSAGTCKMGSQEAAPFTACGVASIQMPKVTSATPSGTMCQGRAPHKRPNGHKPQVRTHVHSVPAVIQAMVPNHQPKNTLHAPASLWSAATVWNFWGVGCNPPPSSREEGSRSGVEFLSARSIEGARLQTSPVVCKDLSTVTERGAVTTIVWGTIALSRLRIR